MQFKYKEKMSLNHGMVKPRANLQKAIISSNVHKQGFFHSLSL